MSLSQKTLVVDEGTWERLQKLKLNMRAKSIDEVVSKLLTEAGA